MVQSMPLDAKLRMALFSHMVPNQHVQALRCPKVFAIRTTTCNKNKLHTHDTLSHGPEHANLDAKMCMAPFRHMVSNQHVLTCVAQQYIQ